jgi:MoaA/NifB/PqqE/SkfB family radical SAM enzyme
MGEHWALNLGNALRVAAPPSRVRLTPASPPLTKVIVEPTTACNLSCRSCVRHAWSEAIGYMCMDTYRSLMQGLRQVPSLGTVAFWGIGEPLLHPDIIEMVSLAKELGAETELITNGLLLDERTAAGLVSAGLDRLVASVDGTTSASQADARSGADLSIVQRNLSGLRAVSRSLQRDNPSLGIEFVITRRNVAELPNLATLAATLEADFIVLTNVLPYSEESKDDILYWLSAGEVYAIPRTRSLPAMSVTRIDAHTKYMQPLHSLLRHANVSDWPTSNSETPYCRFANDGALAVAQDGQVSPCIALMHSYTCYVLGRKKAIQRYTLGNVAQTDVLEIWNLPEFRDFRERVRAFEFSPCVDCGGCVLAETNQEDCFGNTFPVCGDCLWARGVIRCP